MKKRLLITSTLMAAVLACALGTGTYAWYSVTAGGSLNATADGTVEASINGTYDAGEVSLDMSFGAFTAVALSDGEGDSYVWVNGTPVLANNNDALTKSASNTLTWGWNSQTTPEEKAAFAGKTYVVTIAPQGETAGRVRLHDSSQDDLYGATEAITCEFSVAAAAPYALSVTSKQFWYSVDGGNALDASTISVQLHASIAPKA